MKLWKKLDSKIVYKNPWYHITEEKVLNPSGKEGIYSIVNKEPSVFIVALSSEMEITLIQIYRYTTKITAWEVPGGGIMKGETVISAAKRELEEETGLLANKCTIVGQFQCANGISNQIAYTVLAQEFKDMNTTPQHIEGIKLVKSFSFKEAFEMIKKGEISDGLSMNAVTQVALHLGLATLI